jgi:hypothetical protein
LTRQLLHPAVVGFGGFAFRQIRFVCQTFAYFFVVNEIFVITEIRLNQTVELAD